ncbi:MAG: hypothetical protein HZB66_00940 [Candidatus Aenigmarchaeota archaeon]|nr:hypothetical protein [Candidatus Aenigmarchaeota archaeon]
MEIHVDQGAPSELKEYGRHVEKRIYRYYCSGCCRNFETNEKTDKCIRCGHTTLHILYPFRADYRSHREEMLGSLKHSFSRITSIKKPSIKMPSFFNKKTEELPSK